jgi:hypothetical protein
MNKILMALLAGVCLVTVNVIAPPAWAKNPHDKPPGHAKKDKKKKSRTEATASVYLSNKHLTLVQRYYDVHPGALPPGLAKRGGKLPPGLAKRYQLPPGLERQQVITAEIELVPLPPRLIAQLPPLPHEIMYALVGHDLIVVEKKTRKLLDIMRDALPPLP